MSALIGRNVRVEVSKTLGTLLAITAMTNASPAVFSYTGVDPINGTVIQLPPDFPVVELQNQPVRVSNVDSTANTFEAQAVDSSDFSVFPTATTSNASPVSAWSTLGIARSLQAGGSTPSKIDTTTLIDTRKTFVFGQPEDPEITVEAVSNPLSEAAQIVEKAAKKNTIVVFRVTFLQTGEKRLFAGYVSLPSESIPLGELVTSNFSITQVGERLAFAS